MSKCDLCRKNCRQGKSDRRPPLSALQRRSPPSCNAYGCLHFAFRGLKTKRKPSYRGPVCERLTKWIAETTTYLCSLGRSVLWSIFGQTSFQLPASVRIFAFRFVTCCRSTSARGG